MLRCLLDAGADPHSRGWLDNTALHVAAHTAQVATIQELLARGLPCDATNAHGEHAIHLAAGAHSARGGEEDIRHVELLLEAGANIKKSRTNEGCTAAHYAAKVGEGLAHIQTIRYNVNNVAQSGSVETLRLLLDAECPVTKVGGNDL